jgi:hypothetical protein
MKNESFVLGVDLDGVVADFYAGLRPIAAEWLGVPQEELAEDVSYGLPEWDLDTMGGYENLHRYGILYWDLCFMKEKAAVGANLYLEDAPDNVRELRTAGNIVICLANSTNKDVQPPKAQSWEEMETLVMAEHDKWLKTHKP